MKTEFDVDNAAKLSIAIGVIVSVLTTLFFFWPGAAAIGDMVRDKELNPIAGFFGFTLLGIISPVGVFFAVIFTFAIGLGKLEKVIFGRNIKLKQAAEFIIEARGNK